MSWAGLSLVGLAVVMRIASRAVYADFLDAWSLLPLLAGATWMLLGPAAMLWALPAIAFLFLMFPLPYRAESLLSWKLQGVATEFSTVLLRVLGQPAVSEGHVIWVGEERLMVEEACSGMRIFVGVGALAFFWAAITRRAWIDRILLLASVVPLAVFVNAMRITTVGLLYQWFGSEGSRHFDPRCLRVPDDPRRFRTALRDQGLLGTPLPPARTALRERTRPAGDLSEKAGIIARGKSSPSDGARDSRPFSFITAVATIAQVNTSMQQLSDKTSISHASTKGMAARPVAQPPASPQNAFDPWLLWVTFRRCWTWAIPAGAVLAGIAAFAIAKTFEPVYEATHILEANQDYVVFKGVLPLANDLSRKERQLILNDLVLGPVLTEEGIRTAPSLADPEAARNQPSQKASASAAPGPRPADDQLQGQDARGRGQCCQRGGRVVSPQATVVRLPKGRKPGRVALARHRPLGG